MAPPRFSATEMEEVLSKVAKLDRRGWGQIAIASELGVSQQMVCYYLKKLRDRYLERQVVEQESLIAKKMEQYDEVIREAWDAWERSKEDTLKKTVERRIMAKLEEQPKRTRGSGRNELKVIESEMRRVKDILVKEGRLPGAEYLAIIIKCLEAQRILKGLDPVKKLDVNASIVGAIDWRAVAEGVPASQDVLDAQVYAPLTLPAPAATEPNKDLANTIIGVDEADA